MKVNDLGKPKILALACVLALALLTWLGDDRAKTPAVLAGVVSAVQESEGQVRAVAVESGGQRYVVRVTGAYLTAHAPVRLVMGQEVELSVANMKAVKQGLTCELVEVLKAGAVREGFVSTLPGPQGNEALPVDDLKAPLGVKGM